MSMSKDWKDDHHGGAALRGDLLTLDVTHEHDDYVLRVYDPTCLWCGREQRTVLRKETIPLGKDAQGYHGDLDAAKLAVVELAAKCLHDELQSLKRLVPERRHALVEEDVADIYTVVLVDHLGSGVPSCFTMVTQAPNAAEACTNAEARWPKAFVTGVFLGARTELLSGYQSENRFLGDIKNRSIP